MDKGRVYVHCRAGHGRSAAIVYAWLLSKANVDDDENGLDEMQMKALNEKLCKLRDVRETLYTQPNLLKFRSWLRMGK